jgi:hypothetical protein
LAHDLRQREVRDAAPVRLAAADEETSLAVELARELDQEARFSDPGRAKDRP